MGGSGVRTIDPKRTLLPNSLFAAVRILSASWSVDLSAMEMLSRVSETDSKQIEKAALCLQHPTSHWPLGGPARSRYMRLACVHTCTESRRAAYMCTAVPSCNSARRSGSRPRMLGRASSCRSGCSSPPDARRDAPPPALDTAERSFQLLSDFRFMDSRQQSTEASSKAPWMRLGVA